MEIDPDLVVPDPRLSIAERYPTKDEFLKLVRHEATQLAAKRYIVDEDVELLVENASQRYDAAIGSDKAR